MSIDNTPTKSTGNTDNGLMKKLKEFDGLAMSLGNGNDEHNNKRSRNSSETQGSSDASDGNTTGVMFLFLIPTNVFCPKPKANRDGHLFCMFPGR